MIIYREWVRTRKKWTHLNSTESQLVLEYKRYRGWFLLGIIPLYIRSGDWIPY